MRGAAATVAIGIALATADAEAGRSAVRTYSNRDGVPQAQVTALCQDRDGFLWIGTMAGGLGRYDGRRVETFDAATGLPGSSVRALALGPSGELLVSTGNGAAVRTKAGWRSLEMPSGLSPEVNALLVHPDGRLHVAAPGGLFVARAVGAALAPVAAVGTLAGAETIQLVAAADGTLWVGTTRGLARLLPGGALTRYEAKGLPARTVTALGEAPGGRLLVGVSEEGLFSVDPYAGTAVRVGDDEAPGRNVTTLTREAEGGGTWIATSDRGAFRWNGAAGIERFGTAEGLPDARVWAVLEDREGVLWFGTDSGLVKRGPAAFVTYGPEDGFPLATPLYGMAETPDGALWIGAHFEGLFRRGRDGSLRRFTAKDGLPHGEVRGFCATPGGEILVATLRGLSRIVGDRVVPFPLPEGAPRVVDDLLFAGDGGLYLGSMREGLFVLRGGTLSRIGSPVGSSVHSLAIGPDRTIWVGGPGWGVVGMKEGTPPERIGLAEGLPSLGVNAVLEDGRGSLWVATDRGLYWRTLDRRTRILDSSSGLPDSFVYWVGEDRQGFVWAGTNRGVARVAPTGEIRVFTRNDGLGADECNEDGFFCDSMGRVWVTTVGLSLFRGLPAPRRAVPPLVAVTEVRVGTKRAPQGADVVLPPRPEPVTFRFAALSFLDEGATRFRYRLAGLSETWTAAEPDQSETTYGALGPGVYSFEVSATTVDGRAPDAPARVRVTVASPWWYRAPVLAGAALALAVAAVLVVRVRERRLVAASLRLEAVVAERTEELRRLNVQLSELAITDALTGIPNRRAILASAEEAFSLARRRGLPFSVAMIDFDRFKAINDTLGHAEGDRILLEGTRRMVDSLRTEDVLGRYGGEEFLAVFPMTGPEGALAVGERLRRAAASVKLSGDGQSAVPNERSTVSVGVASLLDADRHVDDLLGRADRALYEAKQAGRNRVVYR
jgi:diguanylate cyclase (GGDEF)-like protein